MSIDTKKFPDGFVWGVATSSYQIEGAADADGRTASIWDTFCRTPGKVAGGDTGDRACEHYYRYPDDVRLLADLGIKHYRFSVAWPRIFPEKGKLNRKGLDFYRALLQELKKYGIQPLVTVYHWDLPQWVQDEGGWTNRKTVDYYLEYAGALFAEFGHDVPMWNTHNEPWCAAVLGYGIGVHAPGHTDWREALVSAHHILLSHGLAIRAYREMGLSGRIGMTLNLDYNDPASDRPEDLAAQQRHDGYLNRWFLDPLFKGDYPQDMKEWYLPHIGSFDFVKPGDLDAIGEAGDFLGINYYTRAIVKEGNGHPLLKADYELPEGSEVTDMGWEVHPESLYRLLKRLQQQYTSLPIYITENGAATADRLIEGKVDDRDRIRYVKAHLEQAQRFIAEGGNLQGYYLWSFLDNFEWAFGYEKRFGMVYVDYETQARTPKASAYWYKDVVRANRIVD
ncbi:GH1 family beta-glucosidase [Paenibacillus alkalitolerans]|uniref:GH1 family beta-glucosidase n=1 Tax=Paenibacillus alkalitolerans TaxID=2799335 RepID=UPI0018F70F10|nr:GH1 family beta-glucosidase [Paenibacillus alkalitolerans]